jgi:hypothetical protein
MDKGEDDIAVSATHLTLLLLPLSVYATATGTTFPLGMLCWRKRY